MPVAIERSRVGGISGNCWPGWRSRWNFRLNCCAWVLKREALRSDLSLPTKPVPTPTHCGYWQARLSWPCPRSWIRAVTPGFRLAIFGELPRRP